MVCARPCCEEESVVRSGDEQGEEHGGGPRGPQHRRLRAPGVMVPVAPAAGQMPGWYPAMLRAITDRVVTQRTRAVAEANRALVVLYWQIGREIIARQAEEGWGTKIIDRLSHDLRGAFPEIRGFSPRNLKYMRALAAAWPDPQFVQRPVAQLPWRHQTALLEKLGTSEERLWYGERALAEGWSRDVLVAQIEGRLRERQGRAPSNFSDTLPPPDSDLAQQNVRDPYLFDFLDMAGIRRVWTRRQGVAISMESVCFSLRLDWPSGRMWRTPPRISAP